MDLAAAQMFLHHISAPPALTPGMSWAQPRVFQDPRWLCVYSGVVTISSSHFVPSEIACTISLQAISCLHQLPAPIINVEKYLSYIIKVSFLVSVHYPTQQEDSRRFYRLSCWTLKITCNSFVGLFCVSPQRILILVTDPPLLRTKMTFPLIWVGAEARDVLKYWEFPSWL